MKKLLFLSVALLISSMTALGTMTLPKGVPEPNPRMGQFSLPQGFNYFDDIQRKKTYDPYDQRFTIDQGGKSIDIQPAGYFQYGGVVQQAGK